MGFVAWARGFVGVGTGRGAGNVQLANPPSGDQGTPAGVEHPALSNLTVAFRAFHNATGHALIGVIARRRLKRHGQGGTGLHFDGYSVGGASSKKRACRYSQTPLYSGTTPCEKAQVLRPQQCKAKDGCAPCAQSSFFWLRAVACVPRSKTWVKRNLQ